MKPIAVLLQLLTERSELIGKEKGNIVNQYVEQAKLEYSQLLQDSEWLNYLNMAGVDNWEGYSYAHEMKRDAESDEHS